VRGIRDCAQSKFFGLSFSTALNLQSAICNLKFEIKMILEIALLSVIPDKTGDFERDMARAAQYIAMTPGYQWHEVRRCLDEGKANKYALLVGWDTLEAHTEGFRKSPQYQEWRKLLHHYYDPFPVVEHYGEPVIRKSS
jgi:heme-degrading monooxygenase HmoA